MAKNKQKNTLINEENPYSILDHDHQKAIDLKIEGFKYRDISKEFGVVEQTVKSWFMVSGKCYEGYHYRKNELSEERKERFAQVNDRLQELAVDALDAYADAIAKKKWKAAESILDRAGFQPVQKVEDLTPTKSVVIINRPEKQKDNESNTNRSDDSGIPV